MPVLRTQLAWIFGVETAVSALAAVAYTGTLISFWSNNQEADQRKRKIVASSVLTAFTEFVFALTSLILVLVNDQLVVEALFTGWAFFRFIMYIIGGGSLAFGLAKFYKMADTITWTFAICTGLGFGFLAGATLVAYTVGLTDLRWVFYALSAFSFIVALVVQLFADSIPGATVLPCNDCDRQARGIVRFWVLIFWPLFLVAFLLGVYGAKSWSTSNHVFEQASYLVVSFFALLMPAFVVHSTFNPDLTPLRNAACRAGKMVTNATRMNNVFGARQDGAVLLVSK